MAIVTKTRTYNTGDALSAPNYNADRDEVIAGVNSIDNAQISPTAGILESKLAFSTVSGHNHNGVNSKLIPFTNFDVSGLTPNLPVVVNAGGTAIETRQLVDSDISPTAAIAQSKIAATRSYVFLDYQDLIVEDDVGVNPVVEVDTAFQAIYAYVKTAPVGADIIATITYTDLTPVATITIPDGQQFAIGSASFTVPAGTFLQMNVTQVGSSTPGSKLTVTLSGTTV